MRLIFLINLKKVIDAFVLPITLVLSYFFLQLRYNGNNIIGVFGCLFGCAFIIIADYISKPSEGLNLLKYSTLIFSKFTTNLKKVNIDSSVIYSVYLVQYCMRLAMFFLRNLLNKVLN